MCDFSAYVAFNKSGQTDIKHDKEKKQISSMALWKIGVDKLPPFYDRLGSNYLPCRRVVALATIGASFRHFRISTQRERPCSASIHILYLSYVQHEAIWGYDDPRAVNSVLCFCSFFFLFSFFFKLKEKKKKEASM